MTLPFPTLVLNRNLAYQVPLTISLPDGCRFACFSTNQQSVYIGFDGVPVIPSIGQVVFGRQINIDYEHQDRFVYNVAGIRTIIALADYSAAMLSIQCWL